MSNWSSEIWVYKDGEQELRMEWVSVMREVKALLERMM